MVGERLGRFYGKIKDGVEDVVELVDDMEKPIILDIKGMKRAGKHCGETARSTTELCTTTVSKAKQMVDFGMELKTTLLEQGEDGKGLSADKFATIQELCSGEKIKSALAIATELDDLAIECVNQSTEMIDSIEKGIETLPDIIEDRLDNNLEQASKEGSRDGDPELRDVSPDVDQLERAVQNIEQVNLFTVMSSGKDAFTELVSKGEVCFELFGTIKSFAQNVAEVSDAIANFKLGAMIGKIKDLVADVFRCLRLSDLIRSFAQAIKKLITWIISLFKSVSSKLSSIWGALAHAKDCLMEVIQHVLDSMKLCDDVKDKSVTLMGTCDEVKGHLGNITKLNTESYKSIKDLADGDEIKSMIRLATNMDDIILEAVKKVVLMIKKVTEGFQNLPDVITADMPEDAGKEVDDPEPANVEDDIQELSVSRGAIAEASASEVVKKSDDGISTISSKISKCQDMIVTSRGFSENCQTTIDSFMGVWDLETAMTHLIEMKRLVNLGAMLQQFAEQIKRLVKATVEVLETMLQKLKDIDFIPDQIEDAVGRIRDSLKDAKIDGHRLKKVGIDGSRIKGFGKKFGFGK